MKLKSLVFVLCCGSLLRGAALDERPVRDMSKNKLYAAICAKVGQHLLTPLAEKVGEYCDNDFPLVQQRAFFVKQPNNDIRGLVSGINFFYDRYILMTQAWSTNLTMFDVRSDRELEMHTGHKSALSAVCHVTGSTIATGSKDGEVRVWDLDTQKTTWSRKFGAEIKDLLMLNQKLNPKLAIVFSNGLSVVDVNKNRREAMFPLIQRRRPNRWGFDVEQTPTLCSLTLCPNVPENSQENVCFVRAPEQDCGIQSIGKQSFVLEPADEKKVRHKFERGKLPVMPRLGDDSRYFVNCGGEIFLIDNITGPYCGNYYSDIYSVQKAEMPEKLDWEPRASLEGKTTCIVISPSGDTMALVTQMRDANNDIIRVFKTTDAVVEAKDDDNFARWQAREVREREKKRKKVKKPWFACG